MLLFFFHGALLFRAHLCFNWLEEACNQRRGLFGKSWPVTKIGQFWSHSWRERRWKKTLTLMIVFNGPAALVAAHLAAILTMLLLGAGVLPPVGHPLFDGRPLHFYCQSTGFVAVVLTVLLWRPGRTIFLDRILAFIWLDFQPLIFGHRLFPVTKNRLSFFRRRFEPPRHMHSPRRP